MPTFSYVNCKSRKLRLIKLRVHVLDHIFAIFNLEHSLSSCGQPYKNLKIGKYFLLQTGMIMRNRDQLKIDMSGRPPTLL